MAAAVRCYRDDVINRNPSCAGEVVEILDVKGGQGELVRQAAGRDPAVVGWRGCVIGLQDHDPAEPLLQLLTGTRSPAARGRLLPQFADGHERHAPRHPGQSRGHRVTELVLDSPGRHIGIKDDVAHQPG